MKIKIHYEINGFEDSIIVEGDTIEDVQEQLVDIQAQRGLDPDKNNMWSETLK